MPKQSILPLILFFLCYNSSSYGNYLSFLKNPFYAIPLATYCAWLITPHVKKHMASHDSIKKIVGYDPAISVIPYAHETDKTPVITSLGFGDSKNMYQGKFDTTTTFTVTFAYPETGIDQWYSQPIQALSAVRNINFGQETSAQVLLYSIICCYHRGYKKIHLFGNSQGGALIIRTLDMLANPHHYHHIWQKFNITDPVIQNSIRDMVANGSIFLAHPLMDHNQVINYQTEKITHFLLQSTKNHTPIVQKIISCGQCSLYWSIQVLLMTLTEYNTTSPTPFDLIKNSIDKEYWSFKLYVALADHDEILGPLHNERIIELNKQFPQRLALIQGGKTHYAIKDVLKQFRNFATETNVA